MKKTDHTKSISSVRSARISTLLRPKVPSKQMGPQVVGMANIDVLPIIMGKFNNVNPNLKLSNSNWPNANFHNYSPNSNQSVRQ